MGHPKPRRWIVATVIGVVAVSTAVALVFTGGRAQAGSAVQVSQSTSDLPLPSVTVGNSFAYLHALACPASNGCVAAGEYFASGSEGGLLPIEGNAGWSANSQRPQSGGAPLRFSFSSVACAAVGNCAAVGSYLDNDGGREGLLLSQADGKWGAVTAVPPPVASAKRFVSLGSISCPSTDSCQAVGAYEDSAGNSQALIASSASGSVNEIQAPLPSDAADAGTAASTGSFAGSQLSAVSCASAESCVALGTYYDTTGVLEGLLLNYNGSEWTALKAPLPPDAEQPTDPAGFGLTTVACSTAGNCSAIGDYLGSGASRQGILLSSVGGNWSAEELSLPSDAAQDPQVQLQALACISAGDCTAVGSYVDNSGAGHGLIVTETDGIWGRGTEAQLPTDAAVAAAPSIEAVACKSSLDCVAVGSYLATTGAAQGLILTESGGTWARGFSAELPSNADASGHANLDAVACGSSGQCTAVGSFTDTHKSSQPFAVTFQLSAS